MPTPFQSLRSTGSVDERIRSLGKPSTGFDYMRLSLAIIILIWHSALITKGYYWGSDTMLSPLGVVIRLVLPMFFALSGFLVSGSLERNPSISTFILFRVLRIIPALAVEITLSAVVIGALTTSLSLGAYYAHPMFHSYFLNIVGDIHYNLPGVFTDNPDDTVNRPLWTIPSELECYIFLVAVALAGLHRRRVPLLAVVLVAYATYVAFRIVRDGAPPGFQPFGRSVLSRLLIFYFMGGVLAHRWRSRIPFGAGLFGISVIVALGTLMFEQSVWLSIPAVVYMTVYLGLLNPPKWSLLERGDYSYGIYLYAYPIQQTYVHIIPAAPWYANLALALPTTAAFAMVSWHMVEKPALGLKRRFGRRPTLERVAA